MRFTVIVPIYNASMYVRQCLDSVVVQTFNDFEVVMVDDGSTDESAEICQEYCSLDDRFHLFSHERNKGASAARNTGISQAKGEYLLFLDNDDWWDSSEALQTLNDALTTWGNPDILCYPLGEYHEGDTSPTRETFHISAGIGPSSDYESSMGAIIQRGLYYSSASSKTVKRSVVRSAQLSFDEGLRHNEDSEWSRQLLLACNSSGWLDTSFYVYRRNSAVSQSKQPDYFSVLEAMLSIVQRQVQVSESGAYDEVHSELTASFVSYLYVLALSYIGLLGLNKGSREFDLLKEYRWLLRCGKQDRVTYVRWCIQVAGYRITTRLLGFVMHCEQKRITQLS